MSSCFPYTDEIEAKLNELTLAEKIQLCHGSSKFSVRGISRAGVPDMAMSDGPHGVRREISADSWEPVETGEDYSTYLPAGTAVAATWNTEMGKLHGSVLGAEARERRKDVILGPGFNIIRTPLCGRNFEYYSEDPYLISSLVGGVVRAIQEQGTAACAKHFACNSQELNRSGVNAMPSERALREIYLPGFKAAVDAGVLTVMGAYNFFRGQWCCQNDALLNGILKNEWGFAGAVISDWNGVQKNSYEPAYNGMDIEMGTEKPYHEYWLADPFKHAIENGLMETEILNDKVRRYLFVLYSIGAMGAKRKNRPDGERNSKKHQDRALAIAEEAIVLLKNTDNLLPFSEKHKRILVVGDNAVRVHHAGGASSAVKALYEVTPLEGIKKLTAGWASVEYIADPVPAAGFSIPATILSPADTGAGVNGWRGYIYDQRQWAPDLIPSGEIAFTEMDFDWKNGLSDKIKSEFDWHMVFETTLTAPEDGICQFILDGTQEAGLYMGYEQLIVRSETEGEPDTGTVSLKMEKGKAYELAVFVQPKKVNPTKHVRLTWIPPGSEAEKVSLEVLKGKAAAADAVIYVGGLTHQEDTEGKDKGSLSLPGLQDEIIPALAEANSNFAALMTGGSPYAMPWIEKVPAVVHMWFAGMEGGTAAARILFGRVNPSGKLPFTFPVKLEDSPAHFLDDYNQSVCYYKEDIFVGYRWFDRRRIDPLFCFGHGLSYTVFEYTNLAIKADKKREIGVSFCLTNVGAIAGAEAVQLYLGDDECSVARPIRELKGFKKIFLSPGESRIISMILTEEDVSFFHPTKRQWMYEPGRFTVEIGSSSRDLRLAGTFEY
jgi:beta-glucosidase